MGFASSQALIFSSFKLILTSPTNNESLVSSTTTSEVSIPFFTSKSNTPQLIRVALSLPKNKGKACPISRSEASINSWLISPPDIISVKSPLLVASTSARDAPSPARAIFPPNIPSVVDSKRVPLKNCTRFNCRIFKSMVIGGTAGFASISIMPSTVPSASTRLNGFNFRIPSRRSNLISIPLKGKFGPVTCSAFSCISKSVASSRSRARGTSGINRVDLTASPSGSRPINPPRSAALSTVDVRSAVK